VIGLNNNTSMSPPYQPNPVHRNGTPGKSQWIVPLSAELSAFGRAGSSGWLLETAGWGLHLEANRADYLGTSRDAERQIFFAKFVMSAASWHGYPADHVTNRADIPAPPILRSWLDQEFLRAATIRKITKGQRCSL
jgi:hypothetical protein